MQNPETSIYSREMAFEFLVSQAQEFVDRKYTTHADARQKGMGLAYIEAERQDLAKEVARFTVSMLQQLPQQLDDLRQAQPEMGFAVYAYEPGAPVTLEAHTPDGEVYSWQADTLADAIAKAFPPDDDGQEPDTPVPEVNIFG